MATNGPSDSIKNCCQYPWMGPLLLLKNTADGDEWVLSVYEEMLPMALNGPSDYIKKCCLCPWMDPLLPLKNIADGHGMGPVLVQKNADNAFEWAYCCGWKMLMMATNRPYVSTKKCCRSPWMAPLLLLKSLLMAMNGLYGSPKKCCWYPWMGPLLLLNHATNGYEWVQCF